MPSDATPPLQEPTFYILLSLSQEAKHGYAILKDVEDLSSGKIKLGTGTLYGALSRLLDQGLIQRVDGAGPEDDTHPGKPRKAYALTHSGLGVLHDETARLDGLLSAARRRLKELRA